jgi:hypothetical protein
MKSAMIAAYCSETERLWCGLFMATTGRGGFCIAAIGGMT